MYPSTHSSSNLTLSSSSPFILSEKQCKYRKYFVYLGLYLLVDAFCFIRKEEFLTDSAALPS